MLHESIADARQRSLSIADAFLRQPALPSASATLPCITAAATHRRQKLCSSAQLPRFGAAGIYAASWHQRPLPEWISEHMPASERCRSSGAVAAGISAQPCISGAQIKQV
jgi:hypothetical protein